MIKGEKEKNKELGNSMENMKEGTIEQEKGKVEIEVEKKVKKK